MTGRLRTFIAPAYLLACLLLGGSIQGVGFVLALQLTGLALLAWALIDRSDWHWRRSAKLLPVLFLALVAIALVQLLPLPPGLWSALPGRQFIAKGYALLGQPLPWRPVTLSADSSIALLLTFIPPVTMVVLLVKAKAYSPLGITLALGAGTTVSIVLGFAQVSSGGRFYLYPWVAMGTPAGLFANPNHAAALLLATMPFAIAFAASRLAAAKSISDRLILLSVSGLAIALLSIAIVLNGSLAIVFLGLPAAAASAFLFFPAGRVRLVRIGLLLAALLMIGAVMIAVASRYGIGDSGSVSLHSRQQIWAKTSEAISDNWLTGSGLGTFADVYRLYEDPAAVGPVYINHAHNDYLELALELGVAGVALVALFLLWWTRVAVDVWRSPEAGTVARAASIASAVLLLHSLVDFPLRTASLAALFGCMLGLMSVAEHVASASDARRARHRRIAEAEKPPQPHAAQVVKLSNLLQTALGVSSGVSIIGVLERSRDGGCRSRNCAK